MPVWKSRNVFAASAVMPVRPATRPRRGCRAGPGRVWGSGCPCAPEHGYRPLDTRGTTGLPSGAARRFALVAAMTMCPRCGSTFLQPLRCEAKGSDVVVVELRCPDCMTWLKAPHTRADMRELDRRAGGVPRRDRRRSTSSWWPRAWRRWPPAWGRALELDLVSAPTTSPSRRYATADQAPDKQQRCRRAPRRRRRRSRGCS